jgi:hypothetical protein
MPVFARRTAAVVDHMEGQDNIKLRKDKPASTTSFR